MHIREEKAERHTLAVIVDNETDKVLADAAGGRLFIADSNHNRIVVAALADGAVLDVIGQGESGLADGDFEAAGMNFSLSNVKLGPTPAVAPRSSVG